MRPVAAGSNRTPARAAAKPPYTMDRCAERSTSRRARAARTCTSARSRVRGDATAAGAPTLRVGDAAGSRSSTVNSSDSKSPDGAPPTNGHLVRRVRPIAPLATAPTGCPRSLLRASATEPVVLP